MKLLFSLPVHEKPEVVIDQVLNFLHFNPDCGVVLHLSQAFDFSKAVMDQKTFLAKLSKIENVFVNPTSLRTGLQDMIQAHIANYRYALTVCDFEKFCLCASNDMFFRPGLADYIRPYDCGEKPIEIFSVANPEAPSWYYYAKKAWTDPVLQTMAKDLCADKIYMSHIEGSYYSKALFGELSDLVEKYYDYTKMEIKYPREEVFFATLFMNSDLKNRYSKCPGDVFTWVPWDREGFWALEKDLRRLQKTPGDYFSVKRVARDLNVYLRKILRKNAGYLEQEKALLGSLSENGKLFRSKWKDEIKPNCALFQKKK